jgi:hypothetical protein
MVYAWWIMLAPAIDSSPPHASQLEVTTWFFPFGLIFLTLFIIPVPPKHSTLRIGSVSFIR